METLIIVFGTLFALAIGIWILKLVWNYISNLGTMSGLLFVIAILLGIIIFKLDSLGV